MHRRILGIAACLFAFAATTTRADTVTMMDGRVFTGLVLKDDDTSVTIDAMVHGIRGTFTLAKSGISSVVTETVPAGFFDAPKPTTQSVTAAQAITRPALGPESQSMVDKLTAEGTRLRKQLVALQKELRQTPRMLPGHPVDPNGGAAAFFTGPSMSPNPDYESVKRDIKTTKELLDANTKQMSDFMNTNNAGRQATVEAAKNADAQAAEERAKVLADLQRVLGTPIAAADREVQDLIESKTILEASPAQSIEAIDPRKAVLLKSVLLGMSHRIEDAGKVNAAGPEMNFCTVNYTFKFLTQTGLLRVYQGYVLICEIDGVCWPIQANVDGLGSGMESYQHPLVTPSLWNTIVEEYHAKEQDKEHEPEQQNIVVRVHIAEPNQSPSAAASRPANDSGLNPPEK